jgi:hypothetical protein
MAALEYPCLKISDSISISAGARNDALYGIGSVLLWKNSDKCEGLMNSPFSNVVRFLASASAPLDSAAAVHLSAVSSAMKCLC